MKIVKVESSTILKVGYESDNLFVEFVGGKWYKYLHVPETVFEQFLKASSKGQFLNRFIKPVYREAPLTNRERETVRQICLQQEMLRPIQ